MNESLSSFNHAAEYSHVFQMFRRAKRSKSASWNKNICIITPCQVLLVLCTWIHCIRPTRNQNTDDRSYGSCWPQLRFFSQVEGPQMKKRRRERSFVGMSGLLTISAIHLCVLESLWPVSVSSGSIRLVARSTQLFVQILNQHSIQGIITETIGRERVDGWGDRARRYNLMMC